MGPCSNLLSLRRDLGTANPICSSLYFCLLSEEPMPTILTLKPLFLEETGSYTSSTVSLSAAAFRAFSGSDLTQVRVISDIWSNFEIQLLSKFDVLLTISCHSFLSTFVIV